MRSYYFPRISMMAGTTLGSARVDTSPSSLSALTAILRRMRRMILPLRVLGRPAQLARGVSMQQHFTSQNFQACMRLFAQGFA